MTYSATEVQERPRVRQLDALENRTEVNKIVLRYSHESRELSINVKYSASPDAGELFK